MPPALGSNAVLLINTPAPSNLVVELGEGAHIWSSTVKVGHQVTDAGIERVMLWMCVTGELR